MPTETPKSQVPLAAGRTRLNVNTQLENPVEAGARAIYSQAERQQNEIMRDLREDLYLERETMMTGMAVVLDGALEAAAAETDPDRVMNVYHETVGTQLIDLKTGVHPSNSDLFDVAAESRMGMHNNRLTRDVRQKRMQRTQAAHLEHVEGLTTSVRTQREAIYNEAGEYAGTSTEIVLAGLRELELSRDSMIEQGVPPHTAEVQFQREQDALWIAHFEGIMQEGQDHPERQVYHQAIILLDERREELVGMSPETHERIRKQLFDLRSREMRIQILNALEDPEQSPWWLTPEGGAELEKQRPILTQADYRAVKRGRVASQQRHQ